VSSQARGAQALLPNQSPQTLLSLLGHGTGSALMSQNAAGPRPSARRPSALTPGTLLVSMAGPEFPATSPARSLWAPAFSLQSCRSFPKLQPRPCSLLQRASVPLAAPPALTHLPVPPLPRPPPAMSSPRTSPALPSRPGRGSWR